MAPHISVRDWIRYNPQAAEEEPTSTLVLTSSGNRFVDIRILKEGRELVPQLARDAAILPLSHLDWAFAGTSSTRSTRDVIDGTELIQSVWKHWIDSHAQDAESVSDEGFMFPQADGRTLEKGTMTDPKTGKSGDGAEMWSDVEALTCEKEGAVDARVKCAVLQMEGSSVGEEGEKEVARGMVIRLGQYCQGIIRKGEAFALERWAWTGPGETEGWKRLARMGDLFLPCGPATEHFERLQMNGKVTHEGFTWHVVELEEI